MTFFMKKESGKEAKNVFRITDLASVPEQLRESVKFQEDGTIRIANVDNKKDHFETCYPGVVIAWETTTDPDLPNGYNLWVKGNAAETLEEKNGKFYQKPSIVEAKIISDEFPEFIRGAKISPDGNGWSLVTPWATVSGKYGDIWAKYGVNSKGEVDANIIAVSQTDTVNQYFVCTKEGEVIEPLSEFLKKI